MAGDDDVAQPTVTIMVDGKAIACTVDKPLLGELLAANFVVRTACGGAGSCHLCRVTVLQADAIDPVSSLEKRALGNVLVAQGARLSCQVAVRGAMTIALPKIETAMERRARIQAARARKQRG